MSTCGRSTIAAFLVLRILAFGDSAPAQTAEDFFNPDVLHEVRFYIHPNDWTTLKKNFLDNTYYPADFQWRFQGRYVELTNVRIRSRGTGSRSDIKPGLRVDVDRDEPGRRFLGLKSFVLRNNTQEASMLHERLSMVFFRRLGLPAPRQAHTRLYVNDGYVGLYTIVESVDKAFLRRNFSEDDGYLYKYDYDPEDRAYYFEYRGSDPGLYSPKPFQPETHELDPDPRPLEAMIRAINQSSDSEFVAAVSEYLDLNLFMSHVAIERFLTEQDGVIGAYGMNNFYLYRFEKKNLSQMIPWDKSHAFGGGPEESIWRFITDVPVDQQNRLTRRALLIPELRAAYLSTLARCASAAGRDGGFLLREIEREYSQIREAAREDKNKQCLGPEGRLRLCSNEEFEQSIEDLKDFARLRSGLVLEEVARYLEPASERSYTISNGGGASWSTLGVAESPGIGHGRIQPSAGSSLPAGLAIFGFRQNDVLVTEAGVPATAKVEKGRIYAEVDGAVGTGLAIANPNDEPVTLSFYFTDLEGGDYGQGITTIPAHSQIARFLHESPFQGTIPIRGTFTFTSSLPVAALALRILVNERSETLVTTLPFVEPSTASEATVTLPHFADGGGWTTQIVLLNPTDKPLGGTVEFFGQGSADTSPTGIQVTIDGKASSAFSYSLPARSSRVLRTSGGMDQVQNGSVRVTPAAGSSAPAVSTIFSFRTSGITATEAGVPGDSKGTAFRLYAEVLGTSGEVGAIETGLALANPGDEAVTVHLELTDLKGKSTGLSASIALPARAQVAKFLSQIDGFQALQAPFQGIVRIKTSAGDGVNAVGLRGRFNERGEFLITTTSPVNEQAIGTSTGEVFLPHWADGGGYTTQFVVFNVSGTSTTNGTLRLFSQGGAPLSLTLW